MTALPSPEDFTELAPGWTPERKLRFLDHLAQHGNVRAACARVGLSREAAYRLRRRDGDFARGWAAAMVLAREAAVELLADCATEGIEHRVYFRGELVDSYRKIDTRLLLAHLARLDAAIRDDKAQRDAARFDEVLAAVAGEAAPEELLGRDHLVPLDRSAAAIKIGEEAEKELREEFKREDADGVRAALDIIERQEFDLARRDAEMDVYDDGLDEGKRTWDLWRAHACGYVDFVLADSDAEFPPRTVSDVSTSALAAGLAAAPNATPPSGPPRACPGGGASFESGGETQDSTGPGTSPG